jgi:triacylglycerol lipase
VLGGCRFHLIGHSMGGLVMRCYAQRYASAREVCGFVTLSSPHNGSLWAWTQPTPGGRDMRAGSALLKELATNDHRLEHLKPLSLWTPFDLMILPSHSSVWPVATNERVWLPMHPQLKHSRALTKRVLIYLGDRERPAA